ncbi:MAG: hypothetical protein HOP13_14155 [Alphaproteobacteria bacterium]|nr:hypothetical protein [Alphaproteobacteria bacterium]
MVANYSFGAGNRLMQEIKLLIQVSSQNMRIVEAVGVNNPLLLDDPKLAEAMRQSTEHATWCAKETVKLLAGLKCAHIDAAGKRLGAWADKDESDQTWHELFRRGTSLRDAIETELRDYLFFQYDKAKGERLKAWKSDWEAALAAFPSTQLDVFCATDCYALQHNTASVFHCMRILEIGLKALAASVGLTFDVQQWKNIIDLIEVEIDKIRENGIPGMGKAAKDARLQFLSEAAKEFSYFKDGWRNYVSHNKLSYDEHQALGTLEHVRAFMNQLSKHLSE